MSSSELIEKVGVSNVGFSDPVKTAVKEVQKDREVFWFQVLDQRGRVTNDGEIEFQVILRLGV